MGFAASAWAQESLPAPVVHGNSFEILANSRYSVHSGFTSSLPREVVSNVLWAMNRVPMLGSYREFYVATPQNVYRYDSLAHALVVHLAGDHRYNRTAAYEVGIACERHEEAGYSIMAGLLAATAFNDSAGGSVVACPMKYATDYANTNWNPAHPMLMINVLGQMSARGLNYTVQARSSDSTLPLPRVTGPDTFEIVLGGLRLDSTFSPDPLDRPTVSQLLWAGYGVTPHTASGGPRGTTIPSAVAGYYLTRRIYLARDTGVERYHNRLPPGTGLTTSDHRLETVMLGDRRTELRNACPRLPAGAPCYIVICVADTSRYRDMQEAGFAGFDYLVQASILGLNGWLTAALTPAERAAIVDALALPVADRPAVVFACGAAATGVAESGAEPVRIIHVQTSAVSRAPVRIEYALARAGTPRLAIYDLAGRPVWSAAVGLRPAGIHSVEWNGTDDAGRAVAAGAYFCRLAVGGVERSARVVLAR